MPSHTTPQGWEAEASSTFEPRGTEAVLSSDVVLELRRDPSDRLSCPIRRVAVWWTSRKRQGYMVRQAGRGENAAARGLPGMVRTRPCQKAAAARNVTGDSFAATDGRFLR